MASFLVVHRLSEGNYVMVVLTLSTFALGINILKYAIIYTSMKYLREAGFISLVPLATFSIILREGMVYSTVSMDGSFGVLYYFTNFAFLDPFSYL